MPDAISQPIVSEGWFLLSFIGLALLGLLIGLRWEAAGGLLAIAALLYILAWRMEMHGQPR